MSTFAWIITDWLMLNIAVAVALMDARSRR